MNLKQTLFLTTLLGVTLSVTAKPFGNHDFGNHNNGGIQRIDTDGDGLISLEEFKNKERGPFNRMDADGDGSVSQSELEAHQIEMQARHEQKQEELREHFDRADANEDGFVSMDEARIAAFQRIDQDDNGFLSHEELIQARQHRSQHRSKFRHGPQNSNNAASEG